MGIPYDNYIIYGQIVSLSIQLVMYHLIIGFSKLVQLMQMVVMILF